MSEIIHARNLVKRYGSLTAVDGISFSVGAGECFGFLGPNGAGKTTTIRMITCVSPVTSGELTVDGMDVRREPRRIKAALGVVPQENNLDPDLSVRQNLRVYGRYFDLPRRVVDERIDEALALFQLADREDDPIGALSSGMQRRLTVARGLINAPRILVLDEPTTGLDPQARHLVWQKLRYLRSQGVTMLLTTHYMDEAAHLCDRIVVIHQGRIIAGGTPAELVERFAGQQVVELHLAEGQRDAALQRLAGLDGVRVEEVEDIVYVYVLSGNGFDPGELKLEATRVIYRQADLEDVFLRLTGRGLAE
ncbi:MAG TPA: ABC transporter ATP-binding protein [Dehalococcoidia bacterium]|nr:ABC transporter ATP-binding protein [Dehalococcoidia bacterium]